MELTVIWWLSKNGALWNMVKRVVLDTNLCILLCVGLAERTFIKRHKRLRVFDEADFDLLAKYLHRAGTLTFLPNITTEASNLLRHSAEPMRARFNLMLASIIDRSEERYIPSSVVTKRDEYPRLGLADGALLEAMDKDDQLLTDDFDLYYAAAQLGLDVVNFNHLRESRLDI